MIAALRDRLLATAAILAVVGRRIRPMIRGQSDNAPCIVLSPIPGGLGYTHGGQDDLRQGLVQVDCWGKTWEEADALKELVIATVSGRRFTQSNVEFQGVFVTDARDGFEGDGPARLFRSQLTLRVQHKPA